MKEKFYQLYGLNVAMYMLRPGARWEITNDHFSVWEDPRPCPTMEEVKETMEKIKAFEESIDTIWLEEQVVELKKLGVVVTGKTL
jgi:hypothetical protein